MSGAGSSRAPAEQWMPYDDYNSPARSRSRSVFYVGLLGMATAVIAFWGAVYMAFFEVGGPSIFITVFFGLCALHGLVMIALAIALGFRRPPLWPAAYYAVAFIAIPAINGGYMGYVLWRCARNISTNTNSLCGPFISYTLVAAAFAIITLFVIVLLGLITWLLAQADAQLTGRGIKSHASGEDVEQPLLSNAPRSSAVRFPVVVSRRVASQLVSPQPPAQPPARPAAPQLGRWAIER